MHDFKETKPWKDKRYDGSIVDNHNLGIRIRMNKVILKCS